MSCTYLMIKPEAVRARLYPEILRCLLANRFAIERLEMRRLGVEVAKRFYAEHEGKAFFDDLVRVQ